MRTARTSPLLAAAAIAAFAAPFAACDRKPQPAGPAAGAAQPPRPDPGAHAGDDSHGHGTAPATQLGEQTVNGFTVRASRDGGITPGKDAPIDVWVTGGNARVAAVRFWVGARDGRGSLKARAQIERDNWHTHVEVPDPLPPDSMLWVEIESESGEKTVAGFDLKR
jgi:hypothetical protein